MFDEIFTGQPVTVGEAKDVYVVKSKTPATDEQPAKVLIRSTASSREHSVAPESLAPVHPDDMIAVTTSKVHS